MAQAGYTPIQLYYSSTTTNAPTAGNLASGELAINITDGKLFYKDNGGVVQVIAWKTTPTTAGGTGLTSWTAGDLPYYATGTTLSKLGIGTNGQILTSTGTAPQWSTLSGVAVTTFSAGTTGFTPSSATSGAVTLAGTLATTNGGTGLTSFTANGVVYASSSSALTTGSALTFDGTNLSVTSPSTSTTFTLADNGGRLVVLQNSLGAGGVAQVGTTTNHDFYVRAGAGPAGLNSLYLQAGGVTGYALSYAGASTWYVGGTRSMDLTSTGLGIGTSSPAAKLHVSNGSGCQLYVGLSNNIYEQAYDHIWQTLSGASTKMTLDSSGNLGLGVTPSAWQSGLRALQIGATGSIYNNGLNTAFFGLNYYTDSGGTNRYLASTSASAYGHVSGAHQWFTAPSGTAGNAISFTQAMTLNASGFLGIGQTNPISYLDIYGNGAYTYARFYRSDEAGYGGRVGTGNTLLGAAVARSLGLDGFAGISFGIAGSQVATFDSSGNLGIGTSSPSYKLDVSRGASDGFTARIGRATGTAFYMYSDTTNSYLTTDTSLNNSIGLSATGNYIAFTTTNGTERARIDSAGNLGLGVTPSAWGSAYKAMQIGSLSGMSLMGYSGAAEFGNNFYFDTAYRYAASTSASRYTQSGGAHAWYIAASGTAGNAISFTQAMTLDSNGNLALGRTSVSIIGTDYRTVDLDGLNGSGIKFRSNGTVIGNLYAAGTLYLDLGTAGAYPLTFTTNGTERARITSGGFFKASNTGTYVSSTSDRHEFNSNQDGPTLIANTTSTGANVVNFYSQFPASPNAGALHFVGVISGSGIQFQVDADGDVKNTNGSYGSISDLKLKQDIADAASQWDDIKALRVRKYRFKRTPDAPLQIGVIAQELEQTSPGLVEESADRDEKGNDLGSTTKSVKYSILYMKAVKALQEAMARIEQLEAKVAALEAK